jgi:2-polyprenyl-3-methyl-5-hydroxy-6-metoxy-1,4-benzoquinol methylase
LEKNYGMMNALVPKKGKILDIGCGYGYIDYALYFASKQRNITAIDYDEEKISVAENCFSKDENINFFSCDVMNFNFEKYDAIIMSDVLHYLDTPAQQILLNRCCESLNKDGVLIIHDADEKLQSRHFYTKLTEFFSTRIIRFNKTSGKGLSFFSEALLQQTAKENNMLYERVAQQKYTSNITCVLKGNVEALQEDTSHISINSSHE